MKIDYPPPDATPDEVLAWAEDFGVDLSMLRERLRMTPTERLERHDSVLAFVHKLRDSFKESMVTDGSNRTIGNRAE